MTTPSISDLSALREVAEHHGRAALARIEAALTPDPRKDVATWSEYQVATLPHNLADVLKYVAAEKARADAATKRVIELARADETRVRDISRFIAERDEAQQRADAAGANCERWRLTSIANHEAFAAMRSTINEVVPMQSAEADLLQGPEHSVACEAIASAVVATISTLTAERDALKRERDEARAERDRLRNKVPARVLTDAQLIDEEYAVGACIDAGFGEGGGSPGEWWYERANEIEHEQKRRVLKRQLADHNARAVLARTGEPKDE